MNSLEIYESFRHDLEPLDDAEIAHLNQYVEQEPGFAREAGTEFAVAVHEVAKDHGVGAARAA